MKSYGLTIQMNLFGSTFTQYHFFFNILLIYCYFLIEFWILALLGIKKFPRRHVTYICHSRMHVSPYFFI